MRWDKALWEGWRGLMYLRNGQIMPAVGSLLYHLPTSVKKAIHCYYYSCQGFIRISWAQIPIIWLNESAHFVMAQDCVCHTLLSSALICLFWVRVILPVWSRKCACLCACIHLMCLDCTAAYWTFRMFAYLVQSNVRVAMWLWYFIFPDTLSVCHTFFVAPRAIDHVCLRTLDRASPKHNTWIIKQPVKKTNELNKPALCCRRKQKQIPIHACSIDWYMWRFLGQWINTCPVFIPTGAFSLQVKVVYDWLLLDWNALHVSLIKQEKHICSTSQMQLQNRNERLSSSL